MKTTLHLNMGTPVALHDAPPRKRHRITRKQEPSPDRRLRKPVVPQSVGTPTAIVKNPTATPLVAKVMVKILLEQRLGLAPLARAAERAKDLLADGLAKALMFKLKSTLTWEVEYLGVKINPSP